MDRAAKRGADWHALTLVTLGLVAFGIVMVYSATSASAAVGGGDPIEYLTRQATFAVIGLIGLVGATRIDYHRLRVVAPALVLAALASCVAVLVLGPPVNGARRWLGIGPASFQPSELAKLALAVWLAAHLAKREPPRTLSQLWRPIGLLVGVFSVLILLEPDLGTTIAIGVMVAAVLLVSGTPALTLATAGAVAGAVAFVAVWIEPYRRARVRSEEHTSELQSHSELVCRL